MMTRRLLTLAAASALLLCTAAATADSRTVLNRGWNMFSPQQDVDMGRRVSIDAERQLPMLNDARVDRYVNDLGRRLAARAPGEKFPYAFKVVNDPAVNAFALPGGPIFINLGVIAAADNESQLAGVIAHEIAHVALRHGSEQASKASAAQLPLAILGGILGSESSGAALAQLGANFAMSSILLKNSRTAESEADIIATQILNDSGFDARGMVQFFERIEAEQRGRGPIEFFSNHPSPDNRIERVNQEIAALGGARGASADSREFVEMKRYLASLHARGAQPSTSRRPESGERPSARFVATQSSMLRIEHPDDWQARGRGDALSITPRGGLVNDGRGNNLMSHGVIVSMFVPRGSRDGRSNGRDSRRTVGVSLEEATDKLVQEMRLANRSMRVVRGAESLRVGGERALSTYLSNDSPAGGREIDWLVTVPRPDGLLFVVFTAPEREFQRYEGTFHQMLRSVRFRR